LEYLLRDYRVSYTDDHPDVIATLAAIEGLKSQIGEDATLSTNQSSNEPVLKSINAG